MALDAIGITAPIRKKKRHRERKQSSIRQSVKSFNEYSEVHSRGKVSLRLIIVGELSFSII